MVKALHRAGIEVILDVVYNHTAEGNQLGPTLSLRGIDNAAYYRLVPDKPRYYTDFTGTGNSFSMANPRAIQLIMDSLRYWVLDMHVDGFRFDLAPVLARERPLRAACAPAVCQHQLRRVPRRVHARRPRPLRAQAQRGEWRGQPRRQRRQREPQLGRRRADRVGVDTRDPPAHRPELP